MTFRVPDSQSPFRYLSTISSGLLETLKEMMLPFGTGLGDISQTIPLIPSSGITRRLLSALLEEASPSDITAITMNVAEGDNRYDAHVFARCVGKLLGFQVQEDRWREPISWKVGLYGRDITGDGEGDTGPAELYG